MKKDVRIRALLGPTEKAAADEEGEPGRVATRQEGRDGETTAGKPKREKLSVRDEMR